MTDLTSTLPDSLGSHREAIRRYILGLVRDSTEAEDLTQEAFLRAHKKLPSLRDPTKSLPWLYRIATNVSYDRFRQASFKNQPQSLDQSDGSGAEGTVAASISDPGPRLDLAMEREEMSSCVQRYMSELSDQYRAVILLHDTQGLTNPQIAEMLDISLATVKIRLHRARKKLREALERACLFSSDERGALVCDPKPEDIGP
jgi:RNA polymerase sigma-70 factor (ECF subfamily)